MSMDLEFRLPAIRVLASQSSAVSGEESDGAVSVAPSLRRDADDGDSISSSGSSGSSSRSSDGCRTPTAEEHKIPEALSCPPAPRKARPPPALKLKRKLAAAELQFFEIAAGDEVEAFFRKSFELVADRRIKRRCSCK